MLIVATVFRHLSPGIWTISFPLGYILYEMIEHRNLAEGWQEGRKCFITQEWKDDLSKQRL